MLIRKAANTPSVSGNSRIPRHTQLGTRRKMMRSKTMWIRWRPARYAGPMPPQRPAGRGATLRLQPLPAQVMSPTQRDQEKITPPCQVGGLGAWARADRKDRAGPQTCFGVSLLPASPVKFMWCCLKLFGVFTVHFPPYSLSLSKPSKPIEQFTLIIRSL